MTVNKLEYAAYVFDFDYTLGDSTDGIVMCVNDALGRLNVPQCSREDIRKTVGLTLAETFEQLTGIRDADLGAAFTKLFKGKADIIMTANTDLFPDTTSTLRYLKNNHAKTGIVTTKYHYRIDEILSKFKIHHLIDAIVGGEDVIRAKPDPDGLLFIMRELGVSEENTIFIGDSIVDAKTARNAGVDFIAVTTGATARDAFLDFPHKRIVCSLTELLNLSIQ